MRLSEAIRLGSMMKPQFYGGRSDDGGGVCAREAAADAVGAASWFECPQEWLNFAYKTLVDCPGCGAKESLSGTIAFCLNDAHRWTRERIADYVEQIENEQSAKRLEIDALPLTEQVGQ